MVVNKSYVKDGKEDEKRICDQSDDVGERCEAESHPGKSDFLKFQSAADQNLKNCRRQRSCKAILIENRLQRV